MVEPELIFSQALTILFIHPKNYHLHCSHVTEDEMSQLSGATRGTNQCCTQLSTHPCWNKAAAGDSPPKRGPMANAKAHLVFVVVGVDPD